MSLNVSNPSSSNLLPIEENKLPQSDLMLSIFLKIEDTSAGSALYLLINLF
jgi:hypothetical protein